MDAVANLIREVAAQSKQHDAELAAAAAPVAGGVATLLLRFPVYTKVLDLVTGEEGVVIGGKRENVVIPSA
jgi:hypothetical protein